MDKMTLKDKLEWKSKTIPFWRQTQQDAGVRISLVSVTDALKIATDAVAEEKEKWDRAMKVLDDYAKREEGLSRTEHDHHHWKAFHLRTAHKTITANYDFKEYLDKKVKEEL